ncbi:MAG: transposase [Nitrospirae bacterium]|nr:transposase [Nitrospirota bacterium]
MSRPLRIEFPGAYYHVMNRGLEYRSIFQSDDDREMFLDLLADVSSRWGARILCYCLMKNHYHLCIQTSAIPLSRVMRHVDGVYTQRFNRRHKRDGPLFRGRYRAIIIEEDAYLQAVARYIHRNPVKEGLVQHPERYGWSSLRYYMNDRGSPGWLDTGMLLGYFDGDRRKLLMFMREEEGSEIRAFYAAGRVAPILGSEPFRLRIRSGTYAGRKAVEREISERRYLAPGLEECVRAVGRAFGVDPASIAISRRGVSNLPRQIAMYVCREAGGHLHREIARYLKAGSYSTVTSVCTMMKTRLEHDRALQKRIRGITEGLMGGNGQRAT